MQLGMLCIISAPSGTGKSTLIYKLLCCDCFINNVQLSVSYTTRVKRSNETHGKDYYFISKAVFKNMIINNMFLEYAEVFNNYYGTLKSNIVAMFNTDVDILLNIDWQGAQKIRNMISDVYTIFLLPPSRKELEYRLRNRGVDSASMVISRMQRAIDDISHYKEYDYIVVNDDFDIALKQLQSIILSLQLRKISQKKRYQKLISNLLFNNF